MTLIDCPFCEGHVAASLPLPDMLRCEDCAVAWDVTDADPEPHQVPLAA